MIREFPLRRGRIFASEYGPGRNRGVLRFGLHGRLSCTFPCSAGHGRSSGGRTEAKYIGMIGSRNKIQTVYGRLQEKGVAPEKLKRVHAPIGLAIGALTPEEIAVSIVAEMIGVHRGKHSKI